MSIAASFRVRIGETQWCGIWHGRHRGGRLRGAGGAAQAWCASGHELAAAPWLASVSGEHARHREPYKLHGSTTKRTCGWRPTDDITVIVSRVIDPTEAEPARSKCAPLAVPQLGACASSGRLAAPGSSALPGRGRPTTRPATASHSCSSQPPPKPPIFYRLWPSRRSRRRASVPSLGPARRLRPSQSCPPSRTPCECVVRWRILTCLYDVLSREAR